MLALVVAGLSTGHKIGLATVGAAFIVFALTSSFVLPRRIPNFPGRFMGLYLTIAALFFVAMLAAVLIFGKEKPEAAGAGHTTTAAQTTPAATTTTAAPSAKGDPVAGKAVFTGAAGCSGCHTLKDAGATGNVGPNLDQLKPAQDVVRKQVENGGAAMPPFKGTLSAKQIDDVAAYVFTATHSS
jgi:cytochrome c6